MIGARIGQPALVILVAFVALLAASFALYWMEAVWGRAKLKDYLRSQGWTVVRARWRPCYPIRQARYRVEVERDGERSSGAAFVGGEWTGPVWSRSIDVEWDAE